MSQEVITVPRAVSSQRPNSSPKLRRRPARLLLSLALAASVTLGVANAAHASVTIGHGIGPVTLGETQAKVKKALGQPYNVYCWHARPHCAWQTAGYLQFGRHPSPVAELLFNKSGHVIDILTQTGTQRTSKGIRVGSSLAAVKRAYPSAACYRGGCWLASSGGVVTSFQSSRANGRTVNEVRITAPTDTLTVKLSPPSVPAVTSGPPRAANFTTATITVTDEYGDPDPGAATRLTVSSSASNLISAIRQVGGPQSGVYAVRIASTSNPGTVTITATIAWGPRPLRRVLSYSTTAVLTQT